jgi:uncharacterized protein with GYD domain
MRLIVLLKFGPQSLPDHPDRQRRAAIQAMIENFATSPQIGGQVHDIFLTMGPYDLVIYAEVRDPIAAEAFTLTLSRKLKAEHLALPALRGGEADDVFDVLEVWNGP